MVETAGSNWRWRIAIRLVDIYGLSVPGAQAHLVIMPDTAPVTVEDPPLTDGNGGADGYVQASEQICVIVEVHVGDVVLLEKPSVCFGP